MWYFGCRFLYAQTVVTGDGSDDKAKDDVFNNEDTHQLWCERIADPADELDVCRVNKKRADQYT